MQNYFSLDLFDTLAEKPFPINGDAQRLSLFKHLLDNILRLGDIEHTSDWDPYLTITLTDGTHTDTESGYSAIIIGDFNDTDQDLAYQNSGGITNILIEDFNETHTFNLADITSITLHR